MAKIELYIACLRPRQWIKNLVVIAALIFSRNLFRPEMAVRGLTALGIFCLLSGAIYVFNDLKDFAQDRAHPVKKKRPIASGRVTKPEALVLGLSALAGALAVVMMGRRPAWGAETAGAPTAWR